MKTWNIEIQRINGITNANGFINARIDALVQPSVQRDEGASTTLLSFSEANARVLLLLLKTQLAEFDSRKAKSRR